MSHRPHLDVPAERRAEDRDLLRHRERLAAGQQILPALVAVLDPHGRTNKVVRAAADAAMQRHGLRLGQDHLLAALWERGGRTPGEVAAVARVTTPAVTKLAARMSEAGCSPAGATIGTTGWCDSG